MSKLTPEKLAEILERHDSHTTEHIWTFGPTPTIRFIDSVHKDRNLLLQHIAALEMDVGFYKCCALSGEVPKDGSEPSAIGDKEHE